MNCQTTTDIVGNSREISGDEGSSIGAGHSSTSAFRWMANNLEENVWNAVSVEIFSSNHAIPTNLSAGCTADVNPDGSLQFCCTRVTGGFVDLRPTMVLPLRVSTRLTPANNSVNRTGRLDSLLMLTLSPRRTSPKNLVHRCASASASTINAYFRPGNVVNRLNGEIFHSIFHGNDDTGINP